MMLVVRVPDSLHAERAYAAHVVLNVHLGICHEIVFEPRTDVLVQAAGDFSRTLTMADGLFAVGDVGWPSTASRPARVDEDAGSPALIHRGDKITFAADVFGTAFWYLTRLEEVLSTERDLHGRYPSAASRDENQRPYVDELVDSFGSCLLRLWPNLELRRHRATVVPTHDVDRPFKHLFQTLPELVKGMVRDGIRDDARGALRSPAIRGRVLRGELDIDPFNTFEWLMDQSETFGLRSTFYFICNGGGGLDGSYRIDDPRMIAILRRIHSRGHAIGLHGSYNSAFDASCLAAEVAALRSVCRSSGIELETLRARQHVLRFDPARTPAVWSAAGIDEDSTIGHAGRAGFRCGTCRAFPLFDLNSRSMLKVVERPLIAMDATLLEARYEGLAREAATDRIERLAHSCSEVGGAFVLLWHNCRLADTLSKETYSKALALVSALAD